VAATPTGLNTENSEYNFQPHIDTAMDDAEQSFAYAKVSGKAQNCFTTPEANQA